MSYDIGLVIDGLILVFLAVTIFYAARLSLFLKSFRDGREGMNILIRDLSVTIDKAEDSIRAMKESANSTAFELQEIINESKFLSDELRFMNETGDNLADRLEKLADRNRELVSLMESAGGIGAQKIHLDESRHEQIARKRNAPKEVVRDDSFEIDDFDIDEDDEKDFWALSDGAYRQEEGHKSPVNTEAKSKVRSFAIFDRDYAEEIDQEEMLEETQFHSRAEQDLYEALQHKKRVSKVT